MFVEIVKIAALVGREKIAFKYSNNRNLLISKSDPDLQKSMRSLLSYKPFSIVSIFIGEFLRQKEDFPQECSRVGTTISRSIFV